LQQRGIAWSRTARTSLNDALLQLLLLLLLLLLIRLSRIKDAGEM